MEDKSKKVPVKEIKKMNKGTIKFSGKKFRSVRAEK